MARTPQEETVRQLKILNAQYSPEAAFLGIIIKLAFWMVLIFAGLCFLAKH
jgi:hypothetical protein